MASASSQDLFLSDIDTEVDEPLIYTPVASDSEFEDLLETQSLGDRSTTSTVPTQNSSSTHASRTLAQHRCRQLPGSSPVSTPRNTQRVWPNTGPVRQRWRISNEYSRSARNLVIGLLFASVALSTVFTIGGYWGRYDDVMFLKNVHGVTGRYNAFRSRCFGSMAERGIRVGLLRMAKKVDIIVATTAPDYGGLYLWKLKSWAQFFILTVLQLPQKFIWFFVAMRHLIYLAGYIYTTIVASNFISLSLSRRRHPSIWIPRSVSGVMFRDLRFELRDLEIVPFMGFIAYMPWECLILRLFGIQVFDEVDKKNMLRALKYFVWSGLFFRRATRTWRMKSKLAKIAWCWYSWICFRYFMGA